MDKKEIENILDGNIEFREKLFIRGYLICEQDYDLDNYPFYNNWIKSKISNYYIYTHKKINFNYVSSDKMTIFIVGSVLNPFDGIYDEKSILDKLIGYASVSKEKIIDYINQLTGDFVLGAVCHNDLYLVSDPAGMLFGCYGRIDDKLFISSHTQLIADLKKLTKSKYIQDFENYKFFYKYGLFFPGDLTQYCELRRLLQNHILKYDGVNFKLERFYPTQDLELVENDDNYKKLVYDVKTILSDTLELACKKWDNIAISMTGGMDSKTTLACANGHYDKFKYYSYVSMDGDKIDANAAAKIAQNVGIEHKIYNISTNDSDFSTLNIEKAIIEHNNADYKINANDIRKRIYFSHNKLFDVEVKSWVSEIARANYYKKFGLKRMPKHLSARNMTSMFKVFLFQRKLAKQTDKVFEEFIEMTHFNKFPKGYDESDMYLWEFRYSAWGGMVITNEHSYSNEIFVPFNNRLLLNLMLKAPLEKRISDEFHDDIIKMANENISNTGITVTNWNETKARMYIEKCYFLLNSFFKYL